MQLQNTPPYNVTLSPKSSSLDEDRAYPLPSYILIEKNQLNISLCGHSFSSLRM